MIRHNVCSIVFSSSFVIFIKSPRHKLFICGLYIFLLLFLQIGDIIKQEYFGEGVTMQKKAVKDNARKNIILKAASKRFISDGFEGTSIRSIMEEASAEVGLFYYYFKSKDDIYSAFIEDLFTGYKQRIAALTENTVRAPYTALTGVFGLFADEARRFRTEYMGKMHESTLRDIRDRSLEISVPYIKRILELLISYGAKPLIKTDELAVIMTYGIGNLFLRDEKSRLAGTHSESMKTTALLFGLDPVDVSLSLPRLPYANEADSIFDLAEHCKECFANYDSERMKRLIKKRISLGEVYIISHKSITAGFVMFSKKNKTLDFIAVHPDYRNIGIASRLIVTAMAQYDIGDELSIVTFGEDRPQSDGAKRLYNKFGFTNFKNITVQGVPLTKITAVIPEKALVTE